MADRALGGESRRHVPGIRGAGEVGLVATVTGRVGAGQVVVAVHMALLACQGRVCTSQRKSGGGVIKRRSAPRNRGTASLTGGGERRLDVTRLRGGVVVGQMARHARRIRAGQIVIPIHMAQRAQHRGMCAGQGKAGGGVVKCSFSP